MAIIQLKGYQCERCNHVWHPKTINQENPTEIEIPTICPSCKSPYWNKPRKTISKKGGSKK